MDTTRFDAVLRSLVSGVSRRGILAGLTGSLCAALPVGLTTDDAGAKKKKKKKKKKKPSPPPPASPPPPPPALVTRADATCPGPGDSIAGFPAPIRRAQTFSPLTTGQLVSATLLMGNPPGSSGEVILSLNNVVGGVPTHTSLASAERLIDTIPQGNSPVSFTFANPATVADGTEYALVLHRPGSSTPDDLLWAGNSDDSCPGKAFRSDDGVSEFTADLGMSDHFFTIFVSS